eukprot:1926958-Rhodomonas_salina.3
MSGADIGYTAMPQDALSIESVLNRARLTCCELAMQCPGLTRRLCRYRTSDTDPGYAATGND